MTISYCCHLINEIEIEYHSLSKLPRWLTYAFKYPRVNKYNQVSKRHDGVDVHSICEDILQSYGYSLAMLTDKTACDNCEIALECSDDNADVQASRISSLKLLQNNFNLGHVKYKGKGRKLENKTDTNVHIENLARKSMVYYLSLFDDYSKNYEPISKDDIKSVKSGWIGKNSTYEMVCSLRDCLFQIINDETVANEAICITKDYSGIFSSDDILITRSTVSFRDILKNSGIRYFTVYDEIISNSKDIDNLVANFDTSVDIIHSYLNNYIPNQDGYSFLDRDSINGCELESVSKLYMLQSLKLSISDEYDINVMHIKGRSDCYKFFKLLDKEYISDLLNMKNLDKPLPIVKCVISTFPILFSKVHELRVSFETEKAGMANKIYIRGLIIPSVLKNIFTIVESLNRKSIISDSSIKIRYNSSFDDDLYEKCLRISGNNRIYHNFINNFMDLKNRYPYSYKALKKLVPFSHFTLRKGMITISKKPLLFNVNNDFTLSSSDKDIDVLPINIVNDSTYLSLANSDNIVIVKDTLYYNLSRIKRIMKHIHGTDVTINHTTKTFLDRSLKYVLCSKIADVDSYNSSDVKCYLELYPELDLISTNKVMSIITPLNLTSGIWILCYLMHISDQVPFLDEQYNVASTPNVKSDGVDTIQEGKRTQRIKQYNGYRLDFEESLTYPLSQQSYIIHLVNHVKFNKGFYTMFECSYIDYHNRKSQQLSELTNESAPVLHLADVQSNTIRVSSYDGNIEKTSEDPETCELRTTSGWKKIFSADKLNTHAGSEDISDHTNNITHEHSPNGVSEGHTLNELTSFDSTHLVEMCSIRTRDSDKSVVPVDNCDMFTFYQENEQSIKRVYNDTNLSQSSVNVEFGTVSSESRTHGRVFHCAFDFGYITDTYNSQSDDLVKQLNEIMNRSNKIAASSKTHVIFIFITRDPMTVMEANFIKLIKDTINSDMISLAFESIYSFTDNLNRADLNYVNVEKYIKLFEASKFASVSKFCTKGDVTYSFAHCKDTLKKDLQDIITQIGSDINFKLYGIPVVHNFEHLTKQFESTLSIISDIKLRFQKGISYETVSISWIFDAYFDGVLFFNDDVLRQYTLVFDENTSDNRTNGECTQNGTNNLCSDKHILQFDDSYKSITFLWGWDVYILSNDQILSELDCILYRKYCGIRFRVLGDPNSIKETIENDLLSKLYKFSLNDEDISKYLSHEKIYTNSIILSLNFGENRVKKRKMDDESTSADHYVVKPFINGIKICFGEYDGIPVLDIEWLKMILSTSKFVPFNRYSLLK